MPFSHALTTCFALAIGSAVCKPLDARQTQPCASLAQRKSWTALSNDEKLTFLDAEKCLQSSRPQYGIPGATSIWDELQYVHVRQASYIHGVGAFLPWHRYYVKLHEHLLQRHCGFQSGVPYWDEVVDAANVRASPIWDAKYGFGGDGNGDARCVTDGPFAGLRLRVSMGAAMGDANCLTRNITPSDFVSADQAHVDECFRLETFELAADCYANAPHWAAHAGVGGIMEDGSLAPGDPIFFMHHTNLDRLYWKWQQVHPGRLTEIGGPNVPTAGFLQTSGWSAPGPEFTSHSGDPADQTTLTHNLWMANLLPNTTIGSVLDLHGETICAVYV